MKKGLHKLGKLLVIGASSYVGARIYTDLKDDFEVVGTYFSHCLFDSLVRLDIRNKNDVESLINKEKPNIIIHIANYLSLKYSHNDEEEFIRVNKIGTENIIDASNNIRAKMVFVSSQASNLPDLNLYGKLKKESEEIVQNVNNGYLVIRPALIIGYSPNTKNPRLFNLILRCISENKTEEFDASWKLQPTYIGHVSQIIRKVIVDKLWNQTIPVFFNELVTQYQIAKDILGNFDIIPQQTDQHIHIAPSKDDLSTFNPFNLSPRTYKEMIGIIAKEIKYHLHRFA